MPGSKYFFVYNDRINLPVSRLVPELVFMKLTPV